MRNCLILGSGRSGTSMVAGVLAKAGYFMGDSLWPANEGNPKGMFEAPAINRANEALLAKVLPMKPWLLGRWFYRSTPGRGQRWLARVPLGTQIPQSSRIAKEMKMLTEREPYCFKDPRFSYTLPAWRPFLKDAVLVCVFRDPASTAQSTLKQCREQAYLRSLAITFDEAVEVWTLMYRHILEVHRHQGEWVFLHYNQVLGGEGLDRLQAFLDAPVDRSFPDPSLRRSLSDHLVPEEASQVYQQLCRLAEYEDAKL